eukprot:scaffold631_cov378-Prasinococcus_capsulatus_cf.AAC.3
MGLVQRRQNVLLLLLLLLQVVALTHAPASIHKGPQLPERHHCNRGIKPEIGKERRRAHFGAAHRQPHFPLVCMAERLCRVVSTITAVLVGESRRGAKVEGVLGEEQRHEQRAGYSPPAFDAPPASGRREEAQRDHVQHARLSDTHIHGKRTHHVADAEGCDEKQYCQQPQAQSVERRLQERSGGVRHGPQLLPQGQQAHVRRLHSAGFATVNIGGVVGLLLCCTAVVLAFIRLSRRCQVSLGGNGALRRQEEQARLEARSSRPWRGLVRCWEAEQPPVRLELQAARGQHEDAVPQHHRGLSALQAQPHREGVVRVARSHEQAMAQHRRRVLRNHHAHRVEHGREHGGVVVADQLHAGGDGQQQQQRALQEPVAVQGLDEDSQRHELVRVQHEHARQQRAGQAPQRPPPRQRYADVPVHLHHCSDDRGVPQAAVDALVLPALAQACGAATQLSPPVNGGGAGRTKLRRPAPYPPIS